MSNNNQNKLVPKLRFPEFTKDSQWNIKLFSQLFEFGNGKDYKHLSPGDIPVYGTGGKMVSVNDYLYDGESVCIGRKGTIDSPLFLNGKFWTVDTLFYTHSFKNVIPKFIYYIFLKIDWYNYNEAGGVPSLSKTTISKIKTFIPPVIEEQQKIAACLSSLDDIITAENQKLELLKEHKKGLLQNLFPKTGEILPKLRFLEFKNHSTWVENKLHELTTKIGDGIHTTPVYDEQGEYFFINGNNLIDGRIFIDKKTKEVSKAEFLKYKKELNETTILLSINGTIGNVAFYQNEKVILGKSACYINPSKELNNIFLYYTLQSDRVTRYFTSELTGSTISNLSLKSIRELIVVLPLDFKEQEIIANLLLSLDDLINTQAKKIKTLKLHKKGLLQDLFPDVNAVSA